MMEFWSKGVLSFSGPALAAGRVPIIDKLPTHWKLPAEFDAGDKRQTARYFAHAAVVDNEQSSIRSTGYHAVAVRCRAEMHDAAIQIIDNGFPSRTLVAAAQDRRHGAFFA